MKKLKIRTPMTRDGRTLVYDENRQPVFKESLVEDSPFVRKQFESLNASTAPHLRHEFESVDVPEPLPRGRQRVPVQSQADTLNTVKSKKKAVSDEPVTDSLV